MSEPFVVGLSWRTAPVAVRERLALRDDEVPLVLSRLTGAEAIGEAMLVSTCNRVEVYGVANGDPAAAAAAARHALLDGRDADEALGRALYTHAGGAAVRHVFRVAAALDSLVLGEAQILGQLKAAYQLAVGQGAAGARLGRCLERAFGAAKRTRAETAIARGSSNVSSVAVELAARVFGDLAGRSVLVVGAGKMSALAARHLRQAGVATLVVTNRSAARADALAAELGATARAWEQLPELLAAADVVISSTGAREPILTRALMAKVARARRYRPMVIVDIAVPRDAEPAITDSEGVYLFDIDDLERVVAANLAERARAGEDAARIVEAEAAAFEEWRRSQAVVPTIRALREHFTAVAEAEAQKTIDALARREHTPEQRAQAIRRLAQGLVGKLLHAPQTHLRESPPEQTAARVEALVALFELELGRTPQAEAPIPPDALVEKETA